MTDVVIAPAHTAAAHDLIQMARRIALLMTLTVFDRL
jgi:hypothetical protein